MDDGMSPLTPPMIMEVLPAEIHLKIYDLACREDGTTGCSLSAVSRRIRQLSAEHRYQSIAVCGPTQIRRLLQTLRAVPQELRRIRFLFICDAFSLSEGHNIDGAVAASPRSRREDRRRTLQAQVLADPGGDMLSDLMHAMVMDFKDGTSPVGLSMNLRRNVEEILSLAQETLQILSVVNFDISSDNASFASHCFKSSFPILLHLTVRGPHEIPNDPSFAPMLRTLHVTDDGISTKLAYRLAINFPHLSRIRISRVLEINKRVSMIIALVVHAMRIAQLGKFFAKIPAPPQMSPGVDRMMLVEPGPAHYGSRRRTDKLSLDMLNTLDSKCPGFRLLPNHPGHLRRAEAQLALDEWTKCIQGIPMPWGDLAGKLRWDPDAAKPVSSSFGYRMQVARPPVTPYQLPPE